MDLFSYFSRMRCSSASVTLQLVYFFSNKSQREMNTEQIPGEMADGTVAMDAAPSSAGSFNIGDETSNIVSLCLL